MSTGTDLKPLLLTRSEACLLLGIKLAYYKALVASEALREISIGKRGKRLPYSEAQRFIEERMTTKARAV